MSSIIENNAVIENVEVKVRVKAKSFAQKDKKTMYSIMGFLLNLKEQGVLDDEKVMECLEALPLYKTAAEKTAFFQQDMFDTKKVEDELYKPMVSDYKKAKKEKRTKKEKQVVPRVKKEAVEGEVVKEKKPRVKKVAVETVPVPVPVPEESSVLVEVKESSVPVPVPEKKPRAKKEKVEGEPKRGRKPKEQIVELAQDQPNPTVEEEETLDALIDAMANQVESLSLEDIQVEDVDDMMRELEAEELEEQPPVSVPLVVVQKKEKKVKTPVLKSSEEKPKKTKKTVVVVENPVV